MPSGSVRFEESVDDEHVPHRLGSCVRGQNSEMSLVSSTYIFLREEHIHFLELLTVFLSLTHVVQFLQNHHVLVRMDNTMVISYINWHGGLRSRKLHMLAKKLIMWESPVIVRDAFYRNNEQESGFAIQTEPVVWEWQRFS